MIQSFVSDLTKLPIGGKARALALLMEAGFPIPDWFVILPCDSHGDDNENWKEAARRMGGTRWAVRSSASDEDGIEHSFAGQLDSFLNVYIDEIPSKVEAVRRSGSSARILAYRLQAGLTSPPPVPAVIVQKMVNAEAAGVAFSADPVSGNRSTVVVAAVPGLGDKLVSGEDDSDSFLVDREGLLLDKKPAFERGSNNCCISDACAIEVAALARRCAVHFGKPQDIEWAMEDGHIHLLQSRPITSLRKLPDPGGIFNLWDNSNIAESYNGITTPLTFSFARHVYEEVYRQFVKILRVPQSRIDENRHTFARMLGLIHGRVFYNLLGWYRVLAMLPGYSINRRFMEQMMGVREGLPDDVARELAPASSGWKDYMELASTVAGLAWNHLMLGYKTARYNHRLNEALAPCAIPPEQLRADELANQFRNLQLQLLTRWDAPLINDFFAMIYYGLLRILVRNWCQDTTGSLQNELISGQGGIISAEPAHRIRQMAVLAASDPALVKALSEESQGAIAIKLRSATVLKQNVDSYLEKFGDRCLEELKLESSTLHDDPLMLYRSIGRLASQPELLLKKNPEEKPIYLQAETRAFKSLGWNPVKHGLFGFVLGKARKRVRDRENLRFERTRVFGRVRRIFVELGRRFNAEGFLEDPQDVFYLTVEEILSFVEGTAVTTDLKSLSALRRQEFALYHNTQPDDRFSTRGMVYVANSFQQARKTDPSPPTGDSREGIGCCPGIIRGRVRVILHPRDAVLHPGEILVAPRTDPGWIMLFPSAAGLLVEYGSLLSHSAIVAREMGIPAVVSIPGLTKWLNTGDYVELDGATGKILRINCPPHEAIP